MHNVLARAPKVASQMVAAIIRTIFVPRGKRELVHAQFGEVVTMLQRWHPAAAELLEEACPPADVWDTITATATSSPGTKPSPLTSTSTGTCAGVADGDGDGDGAGAGGADRGGALTCLTAGAGGTGAGSRSNEGDGANREGSDVGLIDSGFSSRRECDAAYINNFKLHRGALVKFLRQFD